MEEVLQELSDSGPVRGMRMSCPYPIFHVYPFLIANLGTDQQPLYLFETLSAYAYLEVLKEQSRSIVYYSTAVFAQQDQKEIRNE